MLATVTTFCAPQTFICQVTVFSVKILCFVCSKWEL